VKPHFTSRLPIVSGIFSILLLIGHPCYGDVTFWGDALDEGADVYVGNTTVGTLTINGSSTLTNSSGRIGRYSGSNGTVSVSDGTWTNTGDLFIGLEGTGSLTIDGTGRVIVGDTLSRGSNGTIHLESGGTLQIGNGGTTGTLATDLTNNGTLIFDVIDSSTTDNAISGTGAFMKNGTGTVTLGGANTYTGATDINSGTLVVNGSLASSATTVNSGGTLGGSGTLGGAITVQSGGTLAPGNAIGTLTGTTATFQGGSLFSLEGSNQFLSRLELSGAATINSGALISFTTENPLTESIYTIMTAASGLDGTVKFTLSGALPSGYDLQYADTALNLVLIPTATHWLGQSNSTWSGENWASDAAGTATTARPDTNSDITFSANGAQNQTAIVLDVDTSIDSLTVDSSAGIQGNKTLNIDDDIVVNSGTLTLSDGVIVTNDDGYVGSDSGSNGTVSVTNATWTNNEDLYIGNSGNGSLTINGTGHVTSSWGYVGYESGSNGTVSVSDGTWTNNEELTIGNYGNGSLTINGMGHVTSSWGYVGYESGSNGAVSVSDGAWTNNYELTIGNYGNGSLTINGTGHVTNTYGYVGFGPGSNGTVSVRGGTWTNNSDLYIGNQGMGSLTINGTGIVIVGDTLSRGVNGTIHLESGGMLQIGNGGTTGTLATDLTNNGTLIFDLTGSSTSDFAISGTGAVIKNGTGTVTLSSNNTYSGGTTISAGILALGGTAGAITGNISVGSGATFAVDRTNNVTISNLISGNGSFAQVGSGVTSIGRNNTYSGESTIQNGTLWAKARQALGTGRVALNGGQLLISSRQEMAANLQVGGNFSWTDGTIAFYDTGSSPASGDLTIGVAGTFAATSGDKTFDFSQVAALDYGTYTLVNATTISAGGVTFLATHGPSTTLFGNFTTTNQTIVYTVTGATSGGSDIQNNGGPNTPVVANYNISVPTITVGASNMVNSLTFTGSNPLTINSEGQLMVSSGTMNVQNGSSVVGGGTLIAPAGLNKEGEGELDVTNTAMVTGTAAVNGGLLSVNGGLVADSVVVNTGGMLGGAGLIQSNVIVSGGLAPGNSPGTLTISGNLELNSGSNTIIEIASPTNFDRIVVGGTATLGGTLNAVGDGGYTIAPGSRFDFLQAGSIVGAFDSITAPEGLRARFLSSGTIGTLLFGPGSYVPMAINPNQVSAAKALDTFIVATDGDRLAVSIALDALTTEQFPSAFDQIMPGFYESLANIAIEQAFAQTQMLNQRISSVRLGAAGFQAIGGISQPLVHDKNGKSAAEAKDASPIVESATATNWNAWALGTGMFSRSTNLGSLQNYNNDAGGFLVGTDYRWSENFVTGLYAGYDYSYAEYNGGGSTKGNSFNFGTYASYAKDGYYADAVIGGGYTGFQTQRSIQFSTIDRTASADPNSGQFTAGINLGKDFEVGKFTLGPIVGAQYTYAGIGSFTESGAESLDLSLGQQNANSLRSTLGGRIAYTWNLNQKIALIPEVRMFWQHEFLNNPRNISASLDGGNGGSFDFKTSDPYRNSVFAGAGITAQFRKNLSGSVFYNVNFGSQTYQSNMVSVGLNFGF